MTNDWYDYRGYRINIREIYETTETRLARSDYRSKAPVLLLPWMPAGERRWRQMKDKSEEYWMQV